MELTVKEIKDKKIQAMLKKYSDKTSIQTMLDAEECGNVSFRAVEKLVFNPSKRNKFIDYIIADRSSLCDAISKMRKLD